MSRWISVDPPLISGAYLPQPGGDGSQLPGLGGVFNPINLDAYQYAGMNPVKYVDPDGNYCEVLVNDNNISITIPVVFKGDAANEKNIERVVKGIESNWSGNFGNYKVDAKVKIVNEKDSGAYNTINLKKGPGRSIVYGQFDIGGDESFDLGTMEADIYEIDSTSGHSKILECISAHEAGHLMGLSDRYDYTNSKAHSGWETNIMGRREMMPDSRNIEQIIKSKITNKIVYEDK